MTWELECPRCLRPHREVERFCKSCGMPLVHPERGEHDATQSRRRGRKVNPLYTEGRLVKVARAANLAQAEFLAGILLGEGIPCMLSSAASIVAVYAPVAGPRDVLVPESGAQAAREALAWSAEHRDSAAMADATVAQPPGEDAPTTPGRAEDGGPDDGSAARPVPAGPRRS
jgi:Putative prokaryotic signal transducing protein